MKLNVTPNGSTVPTAFVTKGRQRVKQYNDTTVYLNNGEEFEIELFNPTRSKVMAKIDLNGVSIGPGVVLNPGQRVFLERYINEPRKFLYMTYEVEGGNSDVQRAIANNGDVAVKFYLEIPTTNITWEIPWNKYCSPPSCSPHDTNNYMSSTSTSPGQGNSTLTSSNNFGTMDFMNFAEMEISAPTIETGRIEKGTNSNQSFCIDHSTFNTFWSWKTEWKILPLSQRPVEVEDLKIFCTNCGSKRKKGSHKFCPICGTKF